MFPKTITKILVPPLKTQGIKTKLVPFIAEHIHWDGKGTYYEPFMGSGVVGFNLQFENAVYSDINPHIIQLYKDIQNHTITPEKIRTYLQKEGKQLAATPETKESHYYKVRERFNNEPNSYDFLFLNRASFNGLMRYNRKGFYNSPFCKKPNRYSKAYITKIVNQIRNVQTIFNNHPNWTFTTETYSSIIPNTKPEDYIYLDPPYIGRNDTYFTAWNETEANNLAHLTQNMTEASYGFSMWKQNKYRTNEHLSQWKGKQYDYVHHYHIGSEMTKRNDIIETFITNR